MGHPLYLSDIKNSTIQHIIKIRIQALHYYRITILKYIKRKIILKICIY